MRVKTLGSTAARSGLGLDHAIGDRLPGALEDQHDVVRGARGCAGQHHLHRPHPEVAPAVLGSAVD
jgi:hypothetical protein